MKTQVFMQRQLDSSITVKQESKNGLFNANDLLTAWNQANPGHQKRLDSYMSLESTHELINGLQKRDPNTTIDCGLIVATRRGKKGGTYMHPILFIDFAMWISVEFKIRVLQWASDGLLQLRHDAGDSYKEMCALIAEQSMRPYDALVFQREAFMLQELSGVKDRQKASEEQMRMLVMLEKANIKLLKEGKSIAFRQKALRFLTEYVV